MLGHTIEANVTATNSTGNTTALAQPIVPLVDNFSGSSVDTNVWTVLNQQGDTSNHEVECFEPGQVTEGRRGHDSDDQPLVGASHSAQGRDTRQHQPACLAIRRDARGRNQLPVRHRIGPDEGRWRTPEWVVAGDLGCSARPAKSSNWLTIGGGGNDRLSGLQLARRCLPDASEIDIDEFTTTSTSANENVDNSTAGLDHTCQGTVPTDATTNFLHLRVLDWSAGSIKFKIDGVDQTSCDVTGGGVPSHPMFFIVDTQMCTAGSSCNGSPNPSDYPQSTVVDYVHISH